MNKLHIKTIQLFDSIILLDCTYNKVEQRVCFYFSLNNNNLLLTYNSTNQFLNFFKFNNLSIENFLLQLIQNTLKEKSIVVTEDDLPF